MGRGGDWRGSDLIRYNKYGTLAIKQRTVTGNLVLDTHNPDGVNVNNVPD